MSQEKQPLVSIIIPVRNSAQSLKRTLEAVRHQSYRDFEIIAIDDASSDNSYAILEDIQKEESRLKIIQLKTNHGAAEARNKGIVQAKGRFIAFLDSDDSWKPNKLERQISWMLENEIYFSCTSYIWYNSKSRKEHYVRALPNVTRDALLFSNTIGCLTVIYDASQLGKHYFPELKRRQDFALWLDILEDVPFCAGLDEPLAVKYVGHNSLSSNKIYAALWTWQMYRKYLGFSRLDSSRYFFSYAWNALKKYAAFGFS